MVYIGIFKFLILLFIIGIYINVETIPKVGAFSAVVFLSIFSLQIFPELLGQPPTLPCGNLLDQRFRLRQIPSDAQMHVEDMGKQTESEAGAAKFEQLKEEWSK